MSWWRRRRLATKFIPTDPESLVMLGAFALSFRLGELYTGTPLAPAKR
jgi:hypothetical protein